MTGEQPTTQDKDVPRVATQRVGEAGLAKQRWRLNTVGADERSLERLNSSGESGEGLLDYEGAARYLCTTPRHVRELWAKRYLAAIKVGRCVRFSKKDLDAFIATRRMRALR
jgi:excisionase family DNA binding protein